MKWLLKSLILLIIGTTPDNLSFLTITTTNIINKITNQIWLNKNSSNNNVFINSKLYVLGDSLSDNGNLKNIINHDFLNLHKIKFEKPFYHDSFTNGDVAASILAKKLGTELLPAWYQAGNNYAVAGAQAGYNSSWKYKIFLNHYNIINQTKQLIKDHKIQKKDYIFIEIGGNDLTTIFDKITLCNPNSLIQEAVKNEKIAIQMLIDAGANNLIIANSPDISKIPQYVNNSESSKLLARKLTNKLNEVLKLNIENLKKYNSKVNFKTFDLQTDFDKLLNLAEKIGKDIIHKSIDWSPMGIFLNRKPQYINKTTLLTMDTNFFFDYIHPNKWAHKKIGEELFKVINKRKSF
ncbi:MAG: SGNH/GDSL hydrolase family protein [Spiroplasma ixodetis]|nr:SGNH/GDSL hydrolase family protein [Spiroplasma ixodetis]MBP1528693.1 SGNH/GDSL hydrolase family protein [Spiroplasma ixodetis]